MFLLRKPRSPRPLRALKKKKKHVPKTGEGFSIMKNMFPRSARAFFIKKNQDQ